MFLVLERCFNYVKVATFRTTKYFNDLHEQIASLYKKWRTDGTCICCWNLTIHSLSCIFVILLFLISTTVIHILRSIIIVNQRLKCGWAPSRAWSSKRQNQEWRLNLMSHLPQQKIPWGLGSLILQYLLEH